MATWTPVNKVTRAEYPEVDDVGKHAYELDPLTAGKYIFRKVADTLGKQPSTPKKEAAPLKPIGVELPEGQET